MKIWKTQFIFNNQAPVNQRIAPYMEVFHPNPYKTKT